MMTVVEPLLRDLKPRRRPSRLLYAFGGILTASGLAHVLILVVSGFQWSGAVSWRKPIVFGLSIGVLLLTIGWVLDQLPDRPRLAGFVAWTLGLSSLAEVGLITMQAWRGRASHFNVFETGDAIVFALMGVMVGVMSLTLMVVLAWSILRRPSDGAVAAAVIAGMALVALGLGIGQWLIELGNDFAAANGYVPDDVTSGRAGSPKFPHAVAFHGIQVFIVSALMLGRSNLSLSRRRFLLTSVITSYTALLGVSSLQALVGSGPTEPHGLTLVAAGSAAVLLASLWKVAGGYLSAVREKGAALQRSSTNA